MGICCTSSVDNVPMDDEIQSPATPLKQKANNDRTNYVFVHTKKYERYFNRQFQVSVCSAKGERKTMEDDHLCQFEFEDHDNYSLFGVFDGHHGAKASKYLAEHLYQKLNNLDDLENNQDITAVIQEMDKEFISNSTESGGSAGSTVVFAIIYSQVKAAVDLDKAKTIRAKEQKPEQRPSIKNLKDKQKKVHKLDYGKKTWLDGFEMEHSGRIFWAGDARGYLLLTSQGNNVPKFEALTMDHNVHNEHEKERIEKMGGKIINGRIDGKIAVSRAFGDSAMKYDGGVVTAECEYKEFMADDGDSLLLCCDGLVEKWSDKTLIQRVSQNLNEKQNDTAKAMGSLIDDAIYEGSDDNISAMLIQFKDGTKQKIENQKYENV